MAPGVLYLVSTPIGHLGDITFRAVETLKSVDWIACEDTRHSKTLFDHYHIHKPLVSYHDFSEKKRAPELVRRLLGGETGALVSDAGTPALADPGYRLIQEAIKEGVRLEALPGASALLTALVVSGLPMHRFVFEGFAPIKDGAKRRWLEGLKSEERTVAFYESPHRLVKTLEAIRDVWGETPIVVARELTKKFEEVLRLPASAQIERFAGKKVLGEFVILLNRGGDERA
jgi:16S rRNA (cytidine1402-2'-O)-methyltransferase